MCGRVRRAARHLAGFTFLAVSACSSKGTASPSCEAYVADASASSAVSFNGDILPIFQKNCATAGGNCHGERTTSPQLGWADGGTDPAVVLASIVGVLSAEDPTMDFVTPSSPARSYLMHKMDGDQCTLATECAGGLFSDEFPNCGSPMPFLKSRLPAAQRGAVRAWIEQGAQSN